MQTRTYAFIQSENKDDIYSHMIHGEDVFKEKVRMQAIPSRRVSGFGQTTVPTRYQ